MSTWEERMSQRAGGMNAQERSRSKPPAWEEDPVARWQEEHQARLDRGFVLVGGTEVMWNGVSRVVGGRWFKPEPAEGPTYCRDCCEWDSEDGVYKITCLNLLAEQRGCRFGHAHHDEEVWLA